MFLSWSMMVGVVARLRDLLLVAQMHQAVGHVPTQPRDEVESLLKKQLGERNGDVASVANEFAAQSLDQERNRTAIIHISWSQATSSLLA